VAFEPQTTMTETTTATTHRRNPVSAFVDDHPAGAFFAATLAISWGLWTLAYFTLGGGETMTEGMMIPGAFGPALAAALVTVLRGDSLRAWAAQIVDWRIPKRWYLVALGVPALGATGASAVYALGGGPVATERVLQMLPMAPVLILVTALIGGGNEEPGWRGFALPQLTETYSAFTASLAIGVVWAIWHFPLFFMGAPRMLSGSLPLYTVLVLAFSVLLTWAYESTGGSVLLAVLFHGAINTSMSFVPIPRSAIEEYGLLVDLAIVTAVLAITLVVLAVDSRRDEGVFDIDFGTSSAVTAVVALFGFPLSVAVFTAMPDQMTTHWTITSSLALEGDDTLPARLGLVVVPALAFAGFLSAEALRQRLRDVPILYHVTVLVLLAFLAALHLFVLAGNL
jgi:membrane protease YdiL (CAAX protease family)